MSTPTSKRDHAKKVALSHRNMSAEAIRANKCASTKAHNATIKAERISASKERSDAWQALSHADQLKVLDSRLGKGLGAKKQRAKIDEAMAKKDKK